MCLQSDAGSAQGAKAVSSDEDMVADARKQLGAARARRRLLQVLLVQDLADSLIALQEIVGELPASVETLCLTMGSNTYRDLVVLERVHSHVGLYTCLCDPIEHHRRRCAGKRAVVATPSTLAVCGLISASASIWKNWPR